MKSSITVMGPLPKQAEIIRQHCRNKNVRLKFAKVENEVPGADTIVIWTNFVSHGIEYAAIKQVGRDRVKLYTGGLGGLKKLIHGMAA